MSASDAVSQPVSAESDAGLIAALDALYDQHMKDAEAHRTIAIQAKDDPYARPGKYERHMRTAIAFKNRATGVGDAKSLAEGYVTTPGAFDESSDALFIDKAHEATRDTSPGAPR